VNGIQKCSRDVAVPIALAGAAAERDDIKGDDIEGDGIAGTDDINLTHGEFRLDLIPFLTRRKSVSHSPVWSGHEKALRHSMPER
jgi:hypothetical protein